MISMNNLIAFTDISAYETVEPAKNQAKRKFS